MSDKLLYQEAIVLFYGLGYVIQAKARKGDTWNTLTRRPLWDWDRFDYRVKGAEKHPQE